MYYPDLATTSQIAGGPFVRAIGWLDASHEFTKGEVDPEAARRLEEFAAAWGASTRALRWPVACGFHTCEFCGDFRAGGNFGVPDGDVLFVCPEMVAHYVTAHRYAPPAEFLRAVMKAPWPRSDGYADAVKPFRWSR